MLEIAGGIIIAVVVICLIPVVLQLVGGLFEAAAEILPWIFGGVFSLAFLRAIYRSPHSEAGFTGLGLTIVTVLIVRTRVLLRLAGVLARTVKKSRMSPRLHTWKTMYRLVRSKTVVGHAPYLWAAKLSRWNMGLSVEDTRIQKRNDLTIPVVAELPLGLPAATS